jgi:hypothetical protein
MTSSITRIDKYHQTRKGKLIFGTVEILAAYGMLSLAIDSGSLWQYGLAMLLFIGGVNNLARAAFSRKVIYVKPKKR